MKTAKKKLNVKLLRKIQRHISEEPRRFMMDLFLHEAKPGEIYIDDNGKRQKFPACGTTACIAGWACALSGQKRPSASFASTASELLNIGEQAPLLFYTENWPTRFYRRYTKPSNGPMARAKIAAARIDHFIATKGAE